MAHPVLAEARAAFDDARVDLAVELLTGAVDDGLDPEDERAACLLAAYASLAAQRPYETIAWVERARDHGEDDEAWLLEAAAVVDLGDVDAATRLVDGLRLPDVPVGDYPPDLVAQLRARTLLLADDVDGALYELDAAIAADVAAPGLFSVLAAMASDGVDAAGERLRTIDEAHLLTAMSGLLAAPPPLQTDVFESWWERFPGDRRVLAGIAIVANRFSLDAAARWSVRLRALGDDDHCPLLGLATDPTRPPGERVDGVLAAYELGDTRAAIVLSSVAAELADDDLTLLVERVLASSSDDLVEAGILGAATSPGRCLRVADDLRHRGAVGAAMALERHATELMADGLGAPLASRA